MTLFTRPGVYPQPVRPSRRLAGLARGDVPVILGYATRGPAMLPVRIESLRQFEALFGPRLSATHLYDAVKGFFETGGRTGYVVRLTGAGGRPAAASFGLWQVAARTPLAALTSGLGAGEPQQWIDALRRAFDLSIPDPGSWGNQLALSVARRGRVRQAAGSFADDARTLVPASLAGFATGAIVIATQGAVRQIVRIAATDARSGALTTAADLAGFALGGADDIALEVVSFDFEVLASGQRSELFTDIHLAEDHPRSLATTLNRNSASLALTPPAGADWTDETLWPADGVHVLTGGTADLENLTVADWQSALAATAAIDEIALIAAPDLALQPQPRRTDLDQPIQPGLDCDSPLARPRGALAGLVVDGATGAPVADVQVLAAGQGALVQTDADGRFFLSGLELTLIELRLNVDGYEPIELFAQSSTAYSTATPDADRETIRLIAVDDIRTFDAEDVITVQRSMGEAGLCGPYRVAVIDPPAPDMTPEALLGWRASLGQDSRLFAAAPWLEVPLDDVGTLAMQPPSGHICGAFAKGEADQGVHRAPANFPLRHAKQLTLDLDEAGLAEFHANSLNAIRSLPGQGLRLMGSRTLAGTHDWQQVSVRRLFDAIEKTLESRLNWAVFEPNGITTRQILRFSVAQFLETLRMRGMFAGASAAEAYTVICNGDNNTPDGISRGELVMDISIAPTRPYEFITFSLAAEADAIEVTERT
jgi:hypothetical protein